MLLCLFQVARSGLTFEVGPIPWGVLDARQLQRSRRLLVSTLQYIHTRNAQMLSAPGTQQSQAHSLAGRSGGSPNKICQRGIKSLCAEHTRTQEELESRWNTDSMPVFRRATTIAYPPATAAGPFLIHPHMQGHDFRPLSIGDPVFVDIEGKNIIPYDPSHAFWTTQENFPGFDEPLYPFFINEAAYYESNIAFALAKKKERPVKVLKAAAHIVSNL